MLIVPLKRKNIHGLANCFSPGWSTEEELTNILNRRAWEWQTIVDPTMPYQIIIKADLSEAAKAEILETRPAGMEIIFDNSPT